MTTELTVEHGPGPASPRRLARVCGFLYLLIILGGGFAPFAFAPTGMMLGDPTAAFLTKILAAKQLYALGGVAQLMVYACDIGVALILYELLKPVSRRLALLAAFFRLVFAAIASANIINHFAALILLGGTDSLSAFTPGQLQALALASLQLRTAGFDIALFFFGMHCLLAGYLLFRSTFFPSILGVALTFGGLVYLANIFARVLPASVTGHLFPYILFPAGIAELALTLWLIFRGPNLSRWNQQAAATGRRV